MDRTRVKPPAREAVSPQEQREMLLRQAETKMRERGIERGEVDEYIRWRIGKDRSKSHAGIEGDINGRFRLGLTGDEARTLWDVNQEESTRRTMEPADLNARRAHIILGSRGKDARQILEDIEAVEGPNSEAVSKMRPQIGGEVMFDSHEHVFGENVEGRHVMTDEHCRRYWENFRNSPTTDMVVLTHNKGLLDSEYVYETLQAHKPKDLEGKKTLWKGIEVKTYDEKGRYTGEIGVISLNPDKRLSDMFHERNGRKSAEEVARMIRDGSELVGFLPHPSESAPDSVLKHLGKERTQKLVGEYGLLGEYHAAYKDTLDAAELGRDVWANPDISRSERRTAMRAILEETVFDGGGIKGMLGAVVAPVLSDVVIPLAKDKAVSIVEKFYDPSIVQEEAKAMLVGGDYHNVDNQGSSYLLVNVPMQTVGEGEALGHSYKQVIQDESGLVLLVPEDRLRTKPVIDAVLEGDCIAVLPQAPTERTPAEFRKAFGKLWGELMAQKKGEGPLLNG